MAFTTDEFDQIVNAEKIQCRVYAPVGQHEDLLAYLDRKSVV